MIFTAFFNNLIKSIKTNRRLILTILASVVVIMVTYSLILPVNTLDKKTAEKQGGITVEESVTAEEEQEDVGAEPEGIEEEKARSEAADTADRENASGTLEYKGEDYRIEASFDENAGFGKSTELRAEEISKDSKGNKEQYDEYLELIAKALHIDSTEAEYRFLKLYDISFIDAEETGKEAAESCEIEPEAPVSVRVEYDEKIPENVRKGLQIVHFTEDKKTGELRAELIDGDKVETEKDAVMFEAESFSVYAIVEEGNRPSTATDVSDIAFGEPYNISIIRSGTNYATENLVQNGDNTELAGTVNIGEAGNWYFEDAGNGKINLYHYDSGVKKYLNVSDTRSISFSDTPQSLNIEKTTNNNGSFYIYTVIGGKNYALSVRSIRNFFFENRNNGAHSNERVVLTKVQAENDPYDFDGKSFGIAYHNSVSTAAALMGEAKDDQHLTSKKMSIKPDVLDNDGVMLVTPDEDITMWTFHNVSGDQYKLSTEVDGTTKYLKLNGQALTIVDSESDATPIKVSPGSGDNAGRYQFSVGGYKIELQGANANNGFRGTTANSASSWLNLVKKSVLEDDDFHTYAAKKVSVSNNDEVYNKQHVVIYTRVWNDSIKRYEFYAVDHDGSLIKCTDTGDNIEWIGSDINTALWEFTEYTDNGQPNYFYELQNVQYGNYIAPQITGDQLFSDDTLGINMNGRRYGSNYTTIIAWDDDNYSYAGLKVDGDHVVTCPFSEADDFYFAVMTTTPGAEEEDHLSGVKTIDNDKYGITMKMIDYNNPIQNRSGASAGTIYGGRDSLQTSILGYDTDGDGILDTKLQDNGYPLTNPEKTGNDQASLAALYDGTTPANHLFIESIYNESGYFEFDSTQNFAHYDQTSGDFTVYDQIAAIADYNSNTGTGAHGQFMPYDDISEGNFCDFTNRTTVLRQELPDTDPRKGEKLYSLGTRDDPVDGIDYFYGMELSASFTQTADGKDAWGHDIIFEFSGDDDFWLYVDGELALDLGGVHYATSGSVNFRTGEIIKSNSTTRTSLYEVFKKHYQDRGLPQSEIDQLLEEKFDRKDVDGVTRYVFKDYTDHDMKIFYMERGAGASNLHMRFNLAAVRPGTFILSKKLSGTDNPTNDLLEFPYQVYYKTQADGESVWHQLLSENETDTKASFAVYDGTGNHVTYKNEFTPAGSDVSYTGVIFLKPGEKAEVDLPEDATRYIVKECGVSSAYDVVKANGSIINASSQWDDENSRTSSAVSPDAKRKDYITPEYGSLEQSAVEYDNHVREGAMRNMELKKKLFDSDDQTELTFDSPDEATRDETLFTFRLYLGSENSTGSTPPANLYPYYIKDGDGNYCRWDAGQKRFVSLGITDYSVLKTYLESCTSAEREAIIFHTSMYGSISKIPAGYSVEVRDLIVDTSWTAEERDKEVPKGYTRRERDGYARMDKVDDEGQPVTIEQRDPISGVIELNEDPEVEIRNQKGWGLTVKKIWTDKDFMESHDDIYFALYLKTTDSQGHERLELVDDLDYEKKTVRSLAAPEDELYYFFGDLRIGTETEYTTYRFDDFILREVVLSDPVVDEDGIVTDYSSITPIQEGGTLTIGGTPVGGTHQEGIDYTVGYDQGQSTGTNSNIRTAKATNSRPGIKLYKTRWDWEHALGGAVFTLKDSDGNNVAAESYTSAESDGLITIAYLNEGTYKLKEIQTPQGYISMDGEMSVTVAQDGTVTITGVDDDYYRLEQATADNMASITIRNKTVSLKVEKVDAKSKAPLAGAHFALYRQVTDAAGNKRKDYLPITGFEDMVTGDDGVLNEITLETVKPGTYYLTETRAPDEYDLIPEDICFTIKKDGTAALEDAASVARISRDDTTQGHVSYVLSVPDGEMNKVSFMKVDLSDTEHSGLSGAKFDLYHVTTTPGEEGQQDVTVRTLIMSDLVSDDTGMLKSGNQSVFRLAAGNYELVETKAPDGYEKKSEPVTLVVGQKDPSDPMHVITYDDGTAYSTSGQGITYNADTELYLIKITNESGVVLPYAGGPGTTWIYLIGSLLTICSLIALIVRLRTQR